VGKSAGKSPVSLVSRVWECNIRISKVNHMHYMNGY
jgi:hypothetical protein